MSANGASLSNPPLAINLHYLVTAYGSNPFDAEILLGWAMQVFHSTPVVPRETIEQALADLVSVHPAPAEQQLISGSTLASQAEHIRITPETLTTEEIYRLWSFRIHRVMRRTSLCSGDRCWPCRSSARSSPASHLQ
jgi:hypothetical protein